MRPLSPTARLSITVTPRASRNEIVLAPDGLRIRVTGPPVEGRANDALLSLLAERLDLPRSCLRIVQGMTSRRKVVDIVGLTDDEVRRRLGIS